jgi:hypothetical protein
MEHVKASMFHLQCKILSEIGYRKNAEAAENCDIFFNSSVFVNALSLTPEVHVQPTKPLQSRLESAVYVCAMLAI